MCQGLQQAPGLQQETKADKNLALFKRTISCKETGNKQVTKIP